MIAVFLKYDIVRTYGHIWDFLHNVIVRSASKVWIKKDFINADSWPTYSDAIPSGWAELNIALPGVTSNSATWISELAWNSTEPWALYPSKYGGNDIDPIGDVYYNKSNDPFSVVMIGGNTWDGFSAGALCWFSAGLPSYIHESIGGRGLEIIS